MVAQCIWCVHQHSWQVLPVVAAAWPLNANTGKQAVMLTELSTQTRVPSNVLSRKAQVVALHGVHVQAVHDLQTYIN